MPDVTAIAAALSGIKTATEIAKVLRGTGRSLEKAEMKLKMAELMSSLADTKMALVDIQDLAHEKDAEIERLEEGMRLKDVLIRHSDAYYEKDQEGSPTGDPYCSRCYEVDHIAVHINQDPKDRRRSICPKCKNSFHWQRRQT